ncbi:FadR family transcriptional regulator [Bordetella avium]|uniref:FadR/GntR family transcriptional regulator n=1 Tax=Bordetella avium TaxID=521 RepID=UPI000FDB7732|nr:FadR/GntR family transcriptional regulator [Bordetella avium]AZY50751.1 FadR family transcriptional regulator [Bordetella avium]
MQTQTLTEQVARQLADAIGQGVYPVGDKLPSGRALAEHYGVSAAVIREATERLRSQGLVRTRQGSGCTVIARTGVQGFQVPPGMDRAALGAVYELRMDLEAGAAALAAQRRDSADLRAMDNALAALGHHLEDPVQGGEHDVAFHLAVASATHNDHYQRLLQYLNLQLRQAVTTARANTARQQGLARAVHDEHIAVFEAIRNGDADAARIAALRHLRNAASRLQLDFSLTD